MKVLCALIVVSFAVALASSSKAEGASVAKREYYHAVGYIKAIGKNAHRTQYSSNPRVRHKWQVNLAYLARVRDRAYSILHPAPRVSWVSIEIAAATRIAQSSSRDPWPNCPDPYDGSGKSWQDTVNCENGGNWYDSPGKYRCGLQFDPSWEQKFGYKFCP